MAVPLGLKEFQFELKWANVVMQLALANSSFNVIKFVHLKFDWILYLASINILRPICVSFVVPFYIIRH